MASDVFREDGLCDLPVNMIISNSNLLLKSDLNFMYDSLVRLKLVDILLVDVCGLSGHTHPSINGVIQIQYLGVD